jgi:4-methylaminobutanoate oxidase (formaldehyde-forming)
MGAVFGEKFGWERVNYFDPGKSWRRMGEDQRNWGGWIKPPFFDRLGQEHVATRERVTLYDLTPFSKIEVSGPGALALLNRVADSEMDKPIGSATYTQFCNPNGGVEADVTVTRLGADRFWVITGAAFIGNDKSWLEMHVDEKDGRVDIRDITEEWACLPLWGPKARDVLRKVTTDDISNETHPYLMTRQIAINGAKVYAQRVSYAGELGWELYVPYNRATMVWDMLLEAGREFGIEVGGYKVLDALRLEKGYRYYTVDVTQLETPYEGGLGFCVDLNKNDFIGKAALAKQKAEGIKRKLCTMVVDGDEFTQIYGGEAVYHEGKVLTRVRSGGWGYTLKKNILYAYLPTELAKAGNRFELELIEGRRFGEVTATVLFDPKGERLRT